MTLRISHGSDATSRVKVLLEEEADSAGTSWLQSPPVLDGQRTVAEQVMAVAAAHDLEEPPVLADFVVDLLEADDLLDKKTWHFSRGEQQVAGLILAFARPFERLILVDPTSGLDQRRSRNLVEFLDDLGRDTDVEVVSQIPLDLA